MGTLSSLAWSCTSPACYGSNSSPPAPDAAESSLSEETALSLNESLGVHAVLLTLVPHSADRAGAQARYGLNRHFWSWVRKSWCPMKYSLVNVQVHSEEG